MVIYRASRICNPGPTLSQRQKLWKLFLSNKQYFFKSRMKGSFLVNSQFCFHINILRMLVERKEESSSALFMRFICVISLKVVNVAYIKEHFIELAADFQGKPISHPTRHFFFPDESISHPFRLFLLPGELISHENRLLSFQNRLRTHPNQPLRLPYRSNSHPNPLLSPAPNLDHSGDLISFTAGLFSAHSPQNRSAHQCDSARLRGQIKL